LRRRTSENGDRIVERKERGRNHRKRKKKSKLSDENVAAAFAEATKGSPDAAKEEETKAAVADESGEGALKPVGALVPFANPLADEKVAKKVLKSVKKAAKNKTLKRGVKEVVKALRKSPHGASNTTFPGVVVLAADISPMDVISHIPVLCEDHNVPYIFVTSRAELGAAGNTKRPTSVVMVSQARVGAKKAEKIEGEEEFADVYKDLVKVVEKETRSVRV